ncbi:MAG: N-6 DNA methylase [bacterium]|nr:N-6 DNA methylase [bacterium]
MDLNINKDKVRAIVAKYGKLTPRERKDLNEAQNCKDFILPLFSALGWDVYSEEVLSEENIGGKRADYGFYLNGRPRFYLEAKKISADINSPEFANQAVRYAWNKGVTWAVLTNFEDLKIFNAQDIKRSLADKLFKNIKYTEYLSRFDELMLLSKSAVADDLLDKEALRAGKIYQRVPVSDTLYKDLNECRNTLTQSLLACNPELKKNPDLLDDGVQKLLDRLIFLRVAEDRGVEPNILKILLREAAVNRKGSTSLYQAMAEKFRELDVIYNSNLFSEHPFEQWDEFDGETEKVIEKLYGKKGYYEYDFKLMPADVLGTVYEHYLAHRLSKSRKGISLDKDAGKRKEQGIYYTPPFVVDYIVKNALEPVLARCKTVADLMKIKILDPACGSGSFLVKALEVLNKRYEEITAQEGTAITKLGFLSQNIYGVDLDNQAVEIARLNLLLASLDERTKLPLLSHNIKNGNSLISGTDKELEKYFGKNFRDKKPFNWEEEFPEVFKQGGFDVVIGNPPYLKELDSKEIFEPIKGTNYAKYYQGKMDLWYFFLHRAIDVVKENGVIGFITNSYFMKSSGSSKLIERMKNETVLDKVVDFDDIKIFGDVSGKHMIHIYTKKQSSSTDKTCYVKINKKDFIDFIDDSSCAYKPYQAVISADYKIDLDIEEEPEFKNCVPLGEVFDVSQGAVEATDKVSKKKSSLAESGIKGGDGVFVLSKDEIDKLKLSEPEREVIKRYLNSNNIRRYSINFGSEYLIYSDGETKNKINAGKYPNLKTHLDRYTKFITSSNKPYGLHRPRETKYLESPKLICKSMFLKPEFSYDDEKYYVGFSFSVIIQKDKSYNLKYLLGILNSKLGERWFNKHGKKRGVGVDIGVLVFRQFPVFKATPMQQKPIIELVDKMLMLNKEFQKVEKGSGRLESLKSEIEKTDNKIDEEVYKLYGLAPEEVKIVEETPK